MIRGLFIGVAIAMSLVSEGAQASSADTDKILEKLAVLEARVATLEAKNLEYKRELEGTRAAHARMDPSKNFRTANAAVPLQPGPLRSRDDHPGIEPGWTGIFWGASAGGAATKSSTTSAGQATIASPGFLTGYNTSDLSAPTSNAGAFIDLFAGANVQVSRLVFGGQLEATASDLNFSSSGARSYSYFDQNGATGATATGNYRPQLTSRWMASALLRAGVLLDDDTLLYGLGGWTFAQFEARNVTDNPFYQPNETFRASGPTGGVGIERKLYSNWRVRAEYRYTKFDTAHTQDQFGFVSGTSSQGYSRSTQFDQSMQSGRIGVAYSFNPLR
ncbi:outer membrane beta-barrel protein [Bradyrhizobium ottawaense]|nr:outer membrane beta-barrel protein [Bradyrhizobium ottawaense]